MTLSRNKNSLFTGLIRSFGRDSYITVSLVLAGIIVLVIAYSGIFSPDSNNYPVVCIHEKLTGEPCFSCGLSHSFSLIVRGRIHEAYEWNTYGMRVFIFFAGQLFLRLAFVAFYILRPATSKQLITLDITSSILMFLLAFFPFLQYLSGSLFK